MARSEESSLAPAAAPPPEAEDEERGPYWYARLLGLRRCDPASLQKRVLEGFRYQTIERLQASGSLTLGEVAELVQIKPRTLSRRREVGRLDPEESDRVLRAARILGLASALFEGDRAAARRWLGSPNRALGGQTPLQAARTGVGAREVERLIGQLEYGVAS